MKRIKKKIKISYIGETHSEDLLIGSHGNTDVRVRGSFQLSGIIYCPKYTVTLDIYGNGKIAFRGKCASIVIRKMKGNCMLDLSEVTYKELRCESLKGNAIVIAGNTRVITPAILEDDAVLLVNENQLVFNPLTSGNSRITNIQTYCDQVN
jgi:hypothetical protein